jgi:hypothetical protein
VLVEKEGKKRRGRTVPSGEEVEVKESKRRERRIHDGEQVSPLRFNHHQEYHDYGSSVSSSVITSDEQRKGEHEDHSSFTKRKYDEFKSPSAEKYLLSPVLYMEKRIEKQERENKYLMQRNQELERQLSGLHDISIITDKDEEIKHLKQLLLRKEEELNSMAKGAVINTPLESLDHAKAQRQQEQQHSKLLYASSFIRQFCRLKYQRMLSVSFNRWRSASMQQAFTVRSQTYKLSAIFYKMTHCKVLAGI